MSSAFQTLLFSKTHREQGVIIGQLLEWTPSDPAFNVWIRQVFFAYINQTPDHYIINCVWDNPMASSLDALHLVENGLAPV
jgi:hypothetical protein